MKQSFSLIVSLAVGTLLLVTTSCRTSHISQQVPSDPSTITKQYDAAPLETVAGAQTSMEDESAFSASEVYTKAQPANAQKNEELVADAATQTNQVDVHSLREQVKHQKIGFAKKAVVMAALKKVEKMQEKADLKALKAQKASGIPEEYKIPVIIGAIGLGLIIIGALAGAGALYTLGAIGLAVGLVWVILILAEVI